MITDTHILDKYASITYSKILPINGPRSGGTLVTVYGQNFLSVINLNQALLCRFGSVRVTSSLIDGSTLTCRAPAFSKAGPVELSLEIDDPRDYFMISKTVRYFYEDMIDIV